MRNIGRYVLCCSILVCGFGFGQQISKKSIWNPNLSMLEIATDNVFELQLKTHRSPWIEVKATMEGEYENAFVISFIENGSTLVVAAQKQQMFFMPNDKLAAHKVLSIGLVVKIPEQLNVLVQGSGTDVTAVGSFNNLNIALGDGNCFLKKIMGSAVVKTFSGDIVLWANKPKLYTKTQYGSTKGRYRFYKKAIIRLNSVKGDIHIRPKTEIY